MDRRQFLRGSAGLGAAGLFPRIAFAEADAYFTGFRKGLKNHPWLAGYTGIADNLDAGPIRFEGSLPKALRGTLFRNGPAMIERAGRRYHHLFDGDGMVQAYHFGDDGLTHRGRFVHTSKFVAESAQGKFLVPGFGTTIRENYPVSSPDSMNAANTSVIAHANRLMALWEGGSAYELDLATLDTKGPVVWNKELKGMPFSAHPKVDLQGTLWNCGAFAGNLVIYQIGPDGKLVKAAVVPVPKLAMNHDFVMSQNYLIFILPDVRMNMEVLRAGYSFVDSLEFNKTAPMRVLTIDKRDFSKQRFYELPPGFLFHYGNAWEDKNGLLRFDYVRHAAGADFMVDSMRALMRGDVESMRPARSASSQVVIDPARGTIREEVRRDLVEFPRVDPRVVGQRYRQLYHTATLGSEGGTLEMNAVIRYDLHRGTDDSYKFANNYAMEEHIVVPRPGSSKEGDGWLVGCAFNAKTAKTELQVFDALNLVAGPLAVAKLPYGVPLGFHGNFHAS